MKAIKLIVSSILYASVSMGVNKPNVIIILTDDQGYGDIAAHGNPIIKTPNIDKLYKESVRFTQFHVSPMCSPTRGEILTGKDAFHNGAVFVNQGKSEIHEGIPTMANIFSENGYATGHFGKWHLGDNYPFRPQDRGFQETIHNGAWGVTSMADYWSNDSFDDTYYHNNELQKYEGYCNDVWFNEATKWIKKQVEENKPFLAYIPTNLPHVPLLVAQKYYQNYIDKVPADVARFYGMITECDQEIGRLMEYLKENKQWDNTILIFMSDNGTATGEKVFNAGMRGKKTSYYEGGHRVPFYISWPAKGIIGGRDIKTPVHSTDILPTLIGLCNLKINNIQFDGMDLSELLEGKKNQLNDRMFVISYKELEIHNSAIIWNKWRLVSYDELYNIEEDPGQKMNLADKFPGIVTEMQNYYDRWKSKMLPLQDKEDCIIIGTKKERETFLSSCNWIGDYCDSWRNIYDNPSLFGYWNIDVATTGSYQIDLYRWPKESSLLLNEQFNNANIMFNYESGIDNPNKLDSLPIHGARLQINDRTYEKTANKGASHVTFEVKLKAGEKVKIEPQLLDSQGKTLCGAYFTYIKRISK